MGRDGGSGGGSSVIMKDGNVLALAGGGGGGGATDYCCAHGGAGGGYSGGNGTSPDTPLSIGEDDDAKGTVRSEFTAKDCTSNECIDSRDKQGLPAFHFHLDRGFAPTASYDSKSLGGTGGTQNSPGKSGNSSKYDVVENNISVTALPGSPKFGGKGADGKEAGGGGGAGFMGGGGGGSGVDGSGGGGGSGFVDFFHVFLSEQNIETLPSPPEVIAIAHDSFEITWYSGINRIQLSNGENVRAFNIELSHGRLGAASEGSKCSDEYELVDRIPTYGNENVMNATMNELYPDTTYCVRLVAISDGGPSERSHEIEIMTKKSPENNWLGIYPRKDLDAMNNRPDVDTNKDKHVHEDESFSSCEIPFRPSPRKGHSLSLINGKAYLFGGITEYCVCFQNSTECERKNVYSNEVWSFDLHTKIWKSLSAISWADPSIPLGREKHSATVLKNGKLLIIGGRADASQHREISDRPLFLGDVWEMDPGQRFTYNHKFNSQPQLISEGGVSYHSTHISIRNKPQHREGKLCVKEVSILLTIEHPCLEQIAYIAFERSDKISSDFITRNAANEIIKVCVKR